MSYKKDKERAIKIRENKKKCCKNCSQLFPRESGEYGCCFLKSKNDIPGGGIIIRATDLDKVRGRCFDEYNGLNLK